MLEINLLETPIVPIVRKDGTHAELTLPDTLDALARDDVQSFREIKVHQSAAIDMFMAQLGVLCADLGDGEFEIPTDVAGWEARLLALAPIEAWHLYSSDTSVSAFMQPGIDPDEFLKTVKSKGKIFSPDEIGVLIVSKNHTVKFSAMPNPSPWHWIASLIETQTLSGFDGRSLYGILRMNMGTSTRFRVATYTDLSASGKWNSDVRKIINSMSDIYRRYPHFDESGLRIGAPWSIAWDGVEQIKVQDLHPLYVDVCRRIRLGRDPDGRLFAATSGSTKMRVLAPDLAGDYGDPWAPLVNKAYKTDGKRKDADAVYTSLTLGSLPIKVLSKIVLGNQDIRPSRLQAFDDQDEGKPAFFCLSAIFRGQGETYGYHDVVIPIPAKIRFSLSNPVSRDALGNRSQRMVELADAASNALKVGIYKFCQPESDEIEYQHSDKSAGTFAKASDAFKLEFSNAFFAHLWDAADDVDESRWISFLKETAERVLETAFKSGSSRTQLSFKAEAQGIGAFRGRWHNLFNKENTK